MKDIMMGTNLREHIKAKKQTSTMKQVKPIKKMKIVKDINPMTGMKIIENIATSPMHMMTEIIHMKYA